MERYCGSCSNKVAKHAQYCDQCGQCLAKRHKPICKHSLSADAKFCSECGLPAKAKEDPFDKSLLDGPVRDMFLMGKTPEDNVLKSINEMLQRTDKSSRVEKIEAEYCLFFGRGVHSGQRALDEIKHLFPEV